MGIIATYHSAVRLICLLLSRMAAVAVIVYGYERFLCQMNTPHFTQEETGAMFVTRAPQLKMAEMRPEALPSNT